MTHHLAFRLRRSFMIKNRRVKVGRKWTVAQLQPHVSNTQQRRDTRPTPVRLLKPNGRPGEIVLLVGRDAMPQLLGSSIGISRYCLWIRKKINQLGCNELSCLQHLRQVVSCQRIRVVCVGWRCGEGTAMLCKVCRLGRCAAFLSAQRQ